MIFILNIIGDNIPSFDMICEENFEIRIMGVMNPHIDVVVLCTCIRSILNPVKFHIGEVFDNLNFLDFSILLHNFSDKRLVHICQSRNEELSD